MPPGQRPWDTTTSEPPMNPANPSEPWYSSRFTHGSFKRVLLLSPTPRRFPKSDFKLFGLYARCCSAERCCVLG